MRLCPYYFYRTKTDFYFNYINLGERLRKLNNKEGICRGLMNIGNIKLQEKLFEEAKTHFDEGLEIAKQIDNEQYKAIAYGNLCILHMNQGNFIDAEMCIKEALNIFNDINDEYGKAHALYNLASIFKETGKRESSIEKWKESKFIFEQIGLPHMVLNIETELSKLTETNSISNDSHIVKQPNEFYIQVIKCKIPDGLVFSFEKIKKDMEMTIEVNELTSFICFESIDKISINDLIEIIRSYYQRNQPDSKEQTKRSEIELKTVHTSKYEITIEFPKNTFFEPTKGGRLRVKSAHGVIEIQKEFSKFLNFEMFSIDRNTLAQRGWASTSSMDIGMVLQKSKTREDGVKVGFQSKNSRLIINRDAQSYNDSLLALLKIELNKIE
jgi:tetratricopeptide (TPR) repeat protein